MQGLILVRARANCGSQSSVYAYTKILNASNSCAEDAATVYFAYLVRKQAQTAQTLT